MRVLLTTGGPGGPDRHGGPARRARGTPPGGGMTSRLELLRRARGATGVSRWWAALLLGVYAAFLLVLTLAPFDFTWSALLDASLGAPRVEWIPFTYACPVHGRFCVYDRITNVLAFLPVGALAVLLPQRAGDWSVRVRRAAAVALAASAVVETAQLFLPSRFPSTADVLLNTLGAWLGAAVVAALARRERGAGEGRRSGGPVRE
jgi:glycopeptide antibiotics resistance protein